VGPDRLNRFFQGERPEKIFDKMMWKRRLPLPLTTPYGFQEPRTGIDMRYVIQGLTSEK